VNLQRPQITDAIAALNERVTNLEGAQYGANNPVDMFKLFAESPLASDAFTISAHKYKVCQGYVFVSPGLIEPSLPCSPTLTI